ncbi:MAG TPA: DUF3142 domain-containing protein [Blastocatellia bacterium]|nr:DUF3142 domain-containing protein [Blastocatellia bacterium]
MAPQRIKRVVILSALAAALAVTAALLALRWRPAALATIRHASIGSVDDRLSDLPRVILWAWERPEDLRFINPQATGVAYLAATIRLRGDRTIIRPRLQPLRLAPGTRRVAVARIETGNRPLYSDEQRRRIVAELIGLAGGENVEAVQIDFDALTSERPFYRALLVDLRGQLPKAVRLSITALASWCYGDNWVADLPIDEAVPMLFRMGADRENIRMRLKAGDPFSVPLARHSLGISTDEPIDGLPAGRRVYVFNPRPWSAESVGQIIREVQEK